MSKAGPSLWYVDIPRRQYTKGKRNRLEAQSFEQEHTPNLSISILVPRYFCSSSVSRCPSISSRTNIEIPLLSNAQVDSTQMTSADRRQSIPKSFYDIASAMLLSRLCEYKHHVGRDIGSEIIQPYRHRGSLSLTSWTSNSDGLKRATTIYTKILFRQRRGSPAHTGSPGDGVNACMLFYTFDTALRFALRLMKLRTFLSIWISVELLIDIGTNLYLSDRNLHHT